MFKGTEHLLKTKKTIKAVMKYVESSKASQSM